MLEKAKWKNCVLWAGCSSFLLDWHFQGSSLHCLNPASENICLLQSRQLKEKYFSTAWNSSRSHCLDMTQSHMLQPHFNKGSNSYFDKDTFMHFRKLCKTSERVVFFALSSMTYHWCMVWPWFLLPLKHCVRTTVGSHALLQSHSCTRLCECLSWGPKQTLQQRRSSVTSVSIPNPPSLFCCVSHVALTRAKVLAGVSVLSDTAPLLWHLRLLGHVKGFHVACQPAAWGMPSLQHPPAHLLHHMMGPRGSVVSLSSAEFPQSVPTHWHDIVGINPVSCASEFC